MSTSSVSSSVYGLTAAGAVYDHSEFYRTEGAELAELEAAMGIASKVEPLPATVAPPTLSPAAVSEPKKKADYLKLFLGALCLAGGALAGVTLMCFMSSPIGWAVAGTLLLAGLVGSMFYGPEVFAVHLNIAICALAVGLAAQLIMGGSGLVVGIIGAGWTAVLRHTPTYANAKPF